MSTKSCSRWIRLWRVQRESEQIRRAPASYVYRMAVSAALGLRRRRAHKAGGIKSQGPARGPALVCDYSACSQSSRLSLLVSIEAVVESDAAGVESRTCWVISLLDPFQLSISRSNCCA